MSNDLKLLAVGLATVLSGLGAARSAEAGTIAVTAGLNSKTIVDNGGDDLDSTLGLISYSGTLGLWTFTVEGTTNPVIGSTTEPLMRLTIDADSTLVTSGETLTVTFVESGFGPSSTAVTATAAGEVAAGGRVT
jgi:hypothetical protein